MVSHLPAASALRRLLPYYRPYPRLLFGGLALVVVSSAIGAVVPWLLRIGIDDLGAGAPLRVIWTIAAGIGGTGCLALFAADAEVGRNQRGIQRALGKQAPRNADSRDAAHATLANGGRRIDVAIAMHGTRLSLAVTDRGAGLGGAMRGISVSSLAEKELLATRGW